jgi:uncharacterized membrane protein YiaA
VQNESRLSSWDRAPGEPHDSSSYLPEVGIVLAVAGGALSALMLALGITVATVGKPWGVLSTLSSIGFAVLAVIWLGAIWLQSRNRAKMAEFWPFSRLSRRQRAAVLLVVGLSITLFLTGLPHLSAGQPVDPTSACGFPLSEHGRITCVTESEYVRAEAAVQQLTAGALSGFAIVAAAAGLAQLGRD